MAEVSTCVEVTVLAFEVAFGTALAEAEGGPLAVPGPAGTPLGSAATVVDSQEEAEAAASVNEK